MPAGGAEVAGVEEREVVGVGEHCGAVVLRCYVRGGGVAEVEEPEGRDD